MVPLQIEPYIIFRRKDNDSKLETFAFWELPSCRTMKTLKDYIGRHDIGRERAKVIFAKENYEKKLETTWNSRDLHASREIFFHETAYYIIPFSRVNCISA